MSDNYTIFVGIGRNVADWPMSDLRWKTFKADVRHFLGAYGADVFFQGESDTAHDELGQTEQSYTFGATIPLRGISGFRDSMDLLAAKYAQRAIAVTWGKTDFVAPTVANLEMFASLAEQEAADR